MNVKLRALATLKTETCVTIDLLSLLKPSLSDPVIVYKRSLKVH